MFSSFQALPQMCMNRLGVISAPFQTFFRTVLPIPLSGEVSQPERRKQKAGPLNSAVHSCSGLLQRDDCQEWGRTSWDPGVWLWRESCWPLKSCRRKGRSYFSSSFQCEESEPLHCGVVFFLVLRPWGRLPCLEQHSLAQPLLLIIYCPWCYAGSSFGNFYFTFTKNTSLTNPPPLFCRGKLFKRNSLLIASVCHISVLFMLGLMIPVSFSLYPQLGTVGIHESLFIAAKIINVFSISKKLHYLS